MYLFTVIGIYDGCVTTTTAYSDDAYAAMRIVAANCPDKTEYLIVGAVKGTIGLVAPCEDSGQVAFACDLADNVSL